jgi:DNA replication protein DnaC
MLIHPTLQKLRSMHLHGMAQALQEQLESSNTQSMAFDERLGLLVDREQIHRENKGFERRLAYAKLKQKASLEDLDLKHSRNLDSALVRSLASGEWVREHRSLIITGPTGTGKTYISCALAQQSCRLGFSALYTQTGRLLQELSIAKADGRYLRILASMARVHLLILDDWGLENPNADQQRILLEILDDRYDKRSTLIASQFPTETWHLKQADPTLADAILDRVLHNAYRIELTGDSLRKTKKKLAQTQATGA